MSDHPRRLERVWIENPIYFITTCTHGRRPILASETIHALCQEVWENAEKLYQWYVGRYVIMPDHVHFFRAGPRASQSLSMFLGKWKEWTAKYAHRRLGIELPVWQAEFFDHVLRSGESYEEKWRYVRHNPVRATLVASPEEWPYQGARHDLRFEV